MANKNNWPDQRGRSNWNDNTSRPVFPKGYLEDGYYRQLDGEPVLRKAYIVGFPRELAKMLSSGSRNINKRSQIRKFYEYALRMQKSLQQNNGNFGKVEAELGRLAPHAAYAKSRRVVSDFFEEFIQRNLEAIHSAEDLNAFCKHFEAIIAYLPKDN